MTNDEMENSLSDIVGSASWVAILKYINLRANMVRYGMSTIDPVTEPTKIARMQGGLSGMEDIPDAIYQIWEGKNQQEAPSEQYQPQEEFRPYDFTNQESGYDDPSPEN